MTSAMETRTGADYQIGDAIQGRWLVRSTCGGRGRSGMGVVYIVDDRLYGGTLAVKTLQPHLVADPTMRALVRTEANLWLAMGRHPNIVALTYVEAMNAQILMFMEYIRPDAAGRNSLTHFLTEHPLDNATVARWSLGTCAALVHMQRRGISVHRDLKPDNLMIDDSGAVRVTDFGLARAHAGVAAPAIQEHVPGATLIGSIVGTPGYIAPEVVAGEQPNVASDVYAFGLILVQMLTGKPWAPFTAQWRGDVLQYERDTLQLRESSDISLPDSPFAVVASKCLEFDPARRYSGFDEVSAALGEVCALQGIRVRAPVPRAAQSQESDDLHRMWTLCKLGRLQEALQLIREMRVTLPDDPALLTHEGDIRAELGDIEGAIPLLQRACDLSPICAHWNNLGKTLRLTQRPQEALTAFQRAIECDPAHANLWASQGNCFYDLGRFAEALPSYERAIALDPYYSPGQLGRARTLAFLERFVDALAALEMVFDVDPEHRQAHALYDQYVATLRAKTPAENFLDIGTRLQECYRQQRFQECLRLIREARYRYGANANGWNDEGIFLTDLGDYRGALRCFEFALRIDPDRCNTWTNKGRVYRRQKKLQEALYCHDRAATLQPQEPLPWFNMYTCYNDLGLSSQARECFRKACFAATSPEHKDMCRFENPDLYYLSMAEIAFGNKDYAEAHRCAASVSEFSQWRTDASQVLARARFYLAVAFAQSDAEGSAAHLSAVVHVLEAAATGIANDEECQAIRQQLDILCRHYLQLAFAKVVQANDAGRARQLLQLSLRYIGDEALLKWVRQQLAVVFSNTAVERHNAHTSDHRSQAVTFLQYALAIDPGNANAQQLMRQIGAQPSAVAPPPPAILAGNVEPWESRRDVDCAADCAILLAPQPDRWQIDLRLSSLKCTKLIALVWSEQRCLGIWCAFVRDEANRFSLLVSDFETALPLIARRLQELGCTTFDDGFHKLASSNQRWTALIPFAGRYGKACLITGDEVAHAIHALDGSRETLEQSDATARRLLDDDAHKYAAIRKSFGNKQADRCEDPRVHLNVVSYSNPDVEPIELWGDVLSPSDTLEENAQQELQRVFERPLNLRALFRTHGFEVTPPKNWRGRTGRACLSYSIESNRRTLAVVTVEGQSVKIKAYRDYGGDALVRLLEAAS